VRTINAMVTVGAILSTAVVFAILACCLPDDPYQRFQLLDGTVYQSLRWNYERVHFDSTPIDVAVIGPSKPKLSISASRVEERLATLGKPAHVVNFSIVADGRNIESVIVDELYKTKRPKVLVVGIDETPSPWGHPAFKYTAPAGAVVFPPAPFLHDYLYGLTYLPFRQLELFAADLFPDSFGLRHTFDPVHFAQTRTDFTTSFRGVAGNLVDMDKEIPRAQLLADYMRDKAKEKRSIVPRAVSRVVEADDRVYTEAIVRQAAAHGTKMVFVYIPRFTGALSPESRAFYGRFGKVQDNGDLAQQDRLFSGWPHLNHAGAMIVSDRVAQAVAEAL
jgi:hypothetical protein